MWNTDVLGSHTDSGGTDTHLCPGNSSRQPTTEQDMYVKHGCPRQPYWQWRNRHSSMSRQLVPSAYNRTRYVCETRMPPEAILTVAEQALVYVPATRPVSLQQNKICMWNTDAPGSHTDSGGTGTRLCPGSSSRQPTTEQDMYVKHGCPRKPYWQWRNRHSSMSRQLVPSAYNRIRYVRETRTSVREAPRTCALKWPVGVDAAILTVEEHTLVYVPAACAVNLQQN